jgi:xanthine dehydrogenase accessory factor
MDANMLVRGTGDVASAVGVVLVRAGYRVALHDEPAPSATRRGMAFADAIYDGTATLAGLRARRIASVDELEWIWAAGEVPVSVNSFENLLGAKRWQVLVDARMRKRTVPECQRGLAPLTIGLGPNFVAGETVDLAVETSWGDRLGAAIARGATLSLQGEPQPLGGVARARFVYAPLAGRFETGLRIGDHVEQGSVVATIGEMPLRAPLTGIIRGLTHDRVDVARNTKVIEVDARDDPAAAFGLGARPKRIADGVLKALTEAPVEVPA